MLQAGVRYLDAAVFRRHDDLGAARLRVGDWLGLDDGLEQGRLRRKVGGGVRDLRLCGVGWGEAGRALVGLGVRDQVSKSEEL